MSELSQLGGLERVMTFEDMVHSTMESDFVFAPNLFSFLMCRTLLWNDRKRFQHFTNAPSWGLAVALVLCHLFVTQVHSNRQKKTAQK